MGLMLIFLNVAKDLCESILVNPICSWAGIKFNFEEHCLVDPKMQLDSMNLNLAWFQQHLNPEPL